jgi:prepilin-type processing-associated H-X9-DG protein
MIGTVFDSACWEQVPRMNNMATTNVQHERDIYENDPFWADDADWDTNALKYLFLDRHNGGINSAFADGGVRFVGIKELWYLKWHKEWKKTLPRNAWPTWTDRFKDY